MESVNCSSNVGTEIINSLNSNSVEIYRDIINSENFDKNDITYEIGEQDLAIQDYQTTLKCISSLEKDKIPQITQNDVSFGNPVILETNETNILEKAKDAIVKMENINSLQTTEDESMAVEALRQLGGICNNVPETDHSLLTCTLCETKFTSTTNLHAHYAVCEQNLSLACSNCQEVFENKIDFNNHNCCLQDIQTCEYCRQNFFNKTDLDLHINAIHSADRIYRCEICNQTFPRSSSLKNHIKIHSYVPGRALFNFVPEETNWNDQLVYDKNTDVLSSFNYNTATCLVQTELNSDVKLSNQDINYEENNLDVVDKNLYPYQNDLNYPIKLEMQNLLLPEVEKDDRYPISSIPQMEVTVTSDGKRPHICSHCGATFMRAKALSSHLKLHSIVWRNKHECDACGECFENEVLQLDHTDNCLLNNTYTEDKSPKLVTERIKKPFLKTKPGKHPCPECDKKFTTKQKMFRHLWIHRKKTYTCEICAQVFEVQVDLDKHRLSQHPMDSPYVCQECGKCFSSRQGLWEHGRVHGAGNAGLYKCSTCSKTFASRQGYLIHNRTHTGERPYGCQFCMKAFRDGGTLRKHERIHTGERPHVCPICLHDFNQKVVLREHVRWVHVAGKTENIKGLYECNLCSFTTKDKEELCAHTVRHSDQLAAQVKAGKAQKTRTIRKNRKVKSKVKKEVDKIEEQLKITDLSDNITELTEVKLSELTELLTKSFVCDMCGLMFGTQKELAAHVVIHI